MEGDHIAASLDNENTYIYKKEVQIMKISYKKHTAREKFVWIRGIKSFKPISPVKCKLLINNTMIVLVQFLILRNLFPYTMPIIVIRNCIFITFSPQEVLQDK